MHQEGWKQVLGRDHLVKISEKPGGSRREGADAAKGVPNWQGPSYELIASWGVHGIDAHVAAAKPHSPLMREGPGRVVLWHHQAMPAASGTYT